MTTFEIEHLDLAAPRPRLGASLAGWFAGLFRRRPGREGISGLDAHMLRDIGLEPMDLTDAMQGGRGPSVLLNPVRRPPQ